MIILQVAREWLRCVDEYDRKSGKLIRMRMDPQTKLVRALVEELESLNGE